MNAEDDDGPLEEDSDPEEALEYFSRALRYAIIVTFVLAFASLLAFIAFHMWWSYFGGLSSFERTLRGIGLQTKMVLFMIFGPALTALFLAVVGFLTTASRDAKRWFTGAGFLAIGWACAFLCCSRF